MWKSLTPCTGADAGVDIELNVRGICCLKTGPRPNGKVIRVVSIVDRYLEHARIFFFHHGGNHQLFIASADWMTRNLDKRVELMVPVTNGKLARASNPSWTPVSGTTCRPAIFCLTALPSTSFGKRARKPSVCSST